MNYETIEYEFLTIEVDGERAFVMCERLVAVAAASPCSASDTTTTAWLPEGRDSELIAPTSAGLGVLSEAGALTADAILTAAGLNRGVR